MNLSTIPVHNSMDKTMKSHETVANPGYVGALSNYEPDAVATRMAMAAIHGMTTYCRARSAKESKRHENQ